MRKVQVLSTVLVNQIAAGEVIVRPASVVKEVVENAIDAGAGRVEVEVSRHCRDISVVDDGEGMSPEDAELAVERHATSKIRDLADLSHIMTRGFRGEALASIAAVSRLEILTRRREDVAGFRFRIEGGRLDSKGPVGCAPGTTVRVRDLFFNTPARRKFLKSDQSEFQAIARLVTRQALARGDLGFSLSRDGKKLFDLPTDQPLGPRMVHLLGNLAESQLVKVNSDRHGVKVFGYVTRPDAARKDRREQHFFVNGRPIVYRAMGYALEQAYHGLLMNGRHPVCCLFVEIPPEEVDVNVHPTKEEVRFREEGKVSGMINRAVVEALRQASLTPEFRFGEQGETSDEEGASGGGAGRFERAAEQLGFAAPPRPYGAGRASGRAGQGDTDRQGRDADSHGRRTSDDLPPLPPLSMKKGKAPIEPPAPPRRGSGEPVINNGPAGALNPAPIVETPPAASPSFETDAFAPRGAPAPLGQAGDSYIVAAQGDDLVIVDQHAAHERIHYNRFLAMLEGAGGDAQPLLLPLTFDVAAEDVDRVEALAPLLARAGVEIEPFGGRTYVIRSAPALMPDLDVAAAIADLLADREETGGLREASPHEALAARLACHAAVKANQRLSPDEMRALVRDLLATADPHTCPHGRPTMIRLTREELDKQFKRK